MAIVHADNFSIYGADAGYMLNGVYADTPAGTFLTSDPDGISGGHVLGMDHSATFGYRGVRKVLSYSSRKVGIATRLWMPFLPRNNGEYPVPLEWLDNGSGRIAWVRVDPTGRLHAYVGSSEVAVTDVPVVTANGWWHLEGFIDVDNGNFEVRVEGIPVIELGSMSFSGLSVAQTRQGCQVDTKRYAPYFKDYVVWNGDGSENNDFLGSVIVHNLTPTSDVALNWTPSTGATGYAILDNIPPTSDYIYAEDDPLPSPYVATLSDLPPEVTSIKALVTYVRAAKNDGGDGSLQVGLISDPDGTPATSLGADRPITVAQTYWMDVHEIDPATSAPWLPDAVNQVQLQINRTT